MPEAETVVWNGLAAVYAPEELAFMRTLKQAGASREELAFLHALRATFDATMIKERG